MSHSKLIPERISVRRGCPHGGWFICAGDEMLYLHSDGVVREGTIYQGKWSGYYRSKKLALAVIAKFEAKNAEATQ
jgi:hypothetical protein